MGVILAPFSPLQPSSHHSTRHYQLPLICRLPTFLDTAPSTEQAHKAAATQQSKTVPATQVSTVASSVPQDIDIRTWPVARRAALMDIPVPIWIRNDPVHISTNGKVLKTTLAMLKATSVTWAAMYTFGRLVMPANTNRDGVVCLIGYLKYVASTSQEVPSMMRVPTDMSAALGVCDAAKVLGMTKYTDHVYKVCDAMLRKAIPSSEDIDVVIAVKDQHARLFDIVVRDLAIQVWEDSIPDPDDFDIYLSNNPVLATAITQCNEAHAEKLRVKAEKKEQYLERQATQPTQTHEERRAQYLEREAARAAHKVAHDQYLERVEYRKVQTTKQEAARAACERSIKEKSQCPLEKRKKFMPEERSHWVKTRGTQPHKGN